jgi:hypothetical protein
MTNDRARRAALQSRSTLDQSTRCGSGEPRAASLWTLSTFVIRHSSFIILALLLCSCRTTPDLPPVNLSEPGWTQRQGQAVWRRERDKPEFAGELLLATRGDRVMLQLTKNPLPFVNVQSRGTQWELKYIQQRRFHHGHGVPDADQIWVHLARALNGTQPPAPLVFQLTAQHGFKLENPKTGETVSGFLSP